MSVATVTGIQFAPGQPWYNTYTMDHWQPQIVSSLNNSTVLSSLIESRPAESVGGRAVIWTTDTGRANAHNTIRPGKGRLTDPRVAGGVNQGTFPKAWNTRYQLDQDTIDRGMVKMDMLANAIDEQMRRGRDDIAVAQNITMFQDGSGRIAEVASTAAGAITLRLNQDIPGNVTSTSSPTQFIDVGMRICFLADDGTSGIIAQVTGVTTTTITVATSEDGATVADHTAIGVTAGDWVVRASTFDTQAASNWDLDTSFKNDPMGIGGIFSTANTKDGVGRFQSITDAGASRTVQTPVAYYGNSAGSLSFQGNDAATNSWNQGVVLSNGNVLRSLTEALMQELFSECEERNSAKVDTLLSGYAMRDTYGSVLLPDKRWVNTTELKGGFTALDFNGRPWYVDRHCQRNCIYGLALADGGFQKLEVSPMRIVTGPGASAWQRSDPNKLIYNVTLYGSWNYKVDLRQRCGGKVTDITEIR